MSGPLELNEKEAASVRGLLPTLEKLLPKILEGFYEWVQTEPTLADILNASSRSVSDLADVQFRHWMDLFRNGPDEEFLLRARKIGEIHYKIGLTPSWYLSGYGYVFSHLIEGIGKANKRDGVKAAMAIKAVNKLLMRDIEIALGVYSNSSAVFEAKATSDAFANEMIDSSIGVSMSVNEAAIASVHMQNAAKEVDNQARSISESVGKTVDGIARISDAGEAVTQLAQKADEHAAEGSQVVDEACARMNEISSVVSETVDAVQGLSETSEDIGDLVTSIEDIASQTNLLALNATIEAARAGDAGKGFAVVATEVKSLAKQTEEATEVIRDSIQGLLKEMHRIVDAMNSTRDSVHAGQVSMEDMSVKMGNLRETVTQVSGQMSEISGILEHQIHSSNDVSLGVIKIADKSRDNIQMLDQVSGSMDRVVDAIGQQLGNFLDYDVPHKVIRVAKSDHIIWKKRLADMLGGKETLNPDELSDHTCCRLGKFYYSDAAEQYSNMQAFKDLEEPHKEVHMNGIEAVRLYQSGDVKAALERMKIVEEASNRVIDLLSQVIDSSMDTDVELF